MRINNVMHNFTNRSLIYEANKRMEVRKVSAGILQCSGFGPLLWYIMHHVVFNLEVPEEVNIVGILDDVAMVSDDVAMVGGNMILNLAEHKTETVLISGKRKKETLEIKLADALINSSDPTKCLGGLIDSPKKTLGKSYQSCKRIGNI